MDRLLQRRRPTGCAAATQQKRRKQFRRAKFSGLRVCGIAGEITATLAPQRTLRDAADAKPGDWMEQGVWIAYLCLQRILRERFARQNQSGRRSFPNPLR